MNSTKNYTVGPRQYFAYGLGNFASQLSWTMVSTYLAVFYTDVFGLAPAAVALLLLIAKVWDGINDPMMGSIMEHTHTKWGRFRPYIFAGAPLMVLFTVLTFTVPGFGDSGKLIWAYVTYIGLGMVYTMTNVPYLGLPATMTNDGQKLNRLMAAQMMGMVIGMIALNLGTLPLVELLGGGDPKNGYQKTATLFALVALPLFWICAKECKEVITVEKEKQGSVLESFKTALSNRNLLCVIGYTLFNMWGMLGRIGVAVYFYLYCVQDFRFITIFMMMQMLVGACVMPFAPRFIEKFGKKKAIFIAQILQAGGLLLMAFGPWHNIPYLFVCHIIYGLGYIAGPSGSVMIVEAVDEYDLKTGVRTDGTGFSLMGLGNKIGSAIGAALGVAIIGWFGYVAGQDITPHAQTGINIAANIMPAVAYIVAMIPVALYNLNDEKVADIRRQLAERNAANEKKEA